MAPQILYVYVWFMHAIYWILINKGDLVILSSNLLSLVIRWSMFFMVDIVVRCMASYFIIEISIYNTSDNDLIVLEKRNFIFEKSLKSLGISFRKKCGNLVLTNVDFNMAFS